MYSFCEGYSYKKCQKETMADETDKILGTDTIAAWLVIQNCYCAGKTVFVLLRR